MNVVDGNLGDIKCCETIEQAMDVAVLALGTSMSIAQGYIGGGFERPKNLLDACLFWDRCQGGTIHAYLPRLFWKRASGPCVRGMGPTPVWHLMLGEKCIGWTQCRKSDRPAITPSLTPNLLDYLPVGCQWID